MTASKIRSAFWSGLILAAIGFFCGSLIVQQMVRDFSVTAIERHRSLVLLLGLGVGIFLAALLLECRKHMRRWLRHMQLTESTRARFLKGELIPYAVFLAYAVVLSGVKANLAFALLVMTAFAVAQLLLLWWAADSVQKARWSDSLDAVPVLFFISGFAALIYQVVWQRVLFATFGVNIESVTVIVSVFMFGLGVGALLGGQVQKYFPGRLLDYFVAIEIAIAVFGVASIPLMHHVGEWVSHDSLPALIITTYALLAFPTTLMGSTLPVLVGYLQTRHGNLGAIVGRLYAFNTFGSALASLLTVMMLFTMLGQQATLVVAALCNILTACGVFRLRGTSSPSVTHVEQPVTGKGAGYIPFAAALLLSASIGYVSLSLEILWFRIIGFMTANPPQVFGTLLAVFLAGIAFSSLKAKRWSEAGRNPFYFLFDSLLWMAVIAYISVPLTGMVSSWIGKNEGIMVGYIAVGLIAYLSGGLFPMLCHMGIGNPDAKRAGEAVSWVYFLNIVGSTLGSLVTGFVLLNIFPIGANILIICAVIVFSLVAFWWSSKPPHRYALSTVAPVLAAGVLLAAWLHPLLYGRIIDRLQGLPEHVSSKYISENRHGIITVIEDRHGDVIFGNGAYDGRFNIDPVLDSNKISRAYMLAALHPDPKQILEIGLSGGSWAAALLRYRPLQSLVSIEINPGYLDLITHYPEIARIFNHPKWTPHIDDGRRWLVNHPDDRFDAIVMNTTFYWRSNATNMLSREFLELCKRHLKPGGILYYNHTGARDSLYTAAHVFRHVLSFQNMVVASDSPFAMTKTQKRKNLMAFADEAGKPLFAAPSYDEVLERLLNEEPTDVRDAMLAEDMWWLITDDNMGSEYKVERSFLPPSFY